MNKNFIVTCNNPKIELKSFADDIITSGFKWIACQKERGEKGTVHIQAAFGGKRIRIEQLRKSLPGCHIEVAKHPRAAFEYCQKQESRVEGPIVVGEPPFASNVKEDQAAKNRRILEIGVEAAVEQGLVNIEKYAQVKKSVELFKNSTLKLADLPSLDHEWVYGPPGVGKSRYARACGDVFVKPINKWWDGYGGQPIVLLDDFEIDHKCLGHYIKIWGDHYPFRAETKGGVMFIRPSKIIITSNYRPEDIWSDPVMVTAINRRF